MFKHIRLIPLVIGLVIGIIAFLFVKPNQNIIYKYPTPQNSGKIVYKDKNDVCYVYKAQQVDCDKNESKLKDYPLNK
jgi:hypothetical protein